MKICIAILLFFLYGPFIADPRLEAALKINVFSSQNGKGLETSRQILKNELSELGHIIYERELNEKRSETCPQVDLNIFFEVINQEWLECATSNWFIPNPECYDLDLTLLDQMDLFLCRTHEVERIFHSMNKRTYYIGFSSHDCLSTLIKKDYRHCFHVAGGSPLKGTQAILNAWREKDYLTNLTILIHYFLPHSTQANVQWIMGRISLSELRLLQNTCGIHLCPSETEGFGHYLMEAMSTGAVVITTDGPPMNEFIVDKRCLVPYVDTAPCNLATRYFVDPEELAKRVEDLMVLPAEELKEIGDRNRRNYLKKTKEFHQNLKQLILTELPNTGVLKEESTDARNWDGTTSSSEEVPVMGMERRSCIRQSGQYSTEQSGGDKGEMTKPFNIPKQLVMQAYKLAKANAGAGGVDRQSYGGYYRSGMYPIWRHFNKTLVAWAVRKYKTYRQRKTWASKFLEKISKCRPRLFVHWRSGMQGAFA